MNTEVFNGIDFSLINDYNDSELYKLYGGEFQQFRQQNQNQTKVLTQNEVYDNESTIPKYTVLNKPDDNNYTYIGPGRKIQQNISTMFNETMKRKYRLIFLNNIAKKKLENFYKMGYFSKNLNDIIDDRLFKTLYNNVIRLYMINMPNGLDVPFEKMNDLDLEDFHEIMKYRTRQGYSDIATIYGPDFARIISNVSPNYLEVFIVYYIKKFAMQYYQKNKRQIKWNDLYPAYDESNIDESILTESWIVKRYVNELKEIKKQYGGQNSASNIISILIKITVITIFIVLIIVVIIHVSKFIRNMNELEIGINK